MQKYIISNLEFEKRIITTHSYHITTVMRMKIDDSIIVSVDGIPYKVKLDKVSNDEVTFVDPIKIDEDTELKINVDLVQGYAKGEKMDFIIQKATELGVAGIYPIIMERSIVKLEENKKKSKIERMEKIAVEATRQSHRNIIPKIYPIFNLKEIDYQKYDYILVAYEEMARQNEISNFKKTLKNININQSILLIVGPEGGISDEEIKYLSTKNAIICGLGPRILRTETAGLYMLSAISYETEL